MRWTESDGENSHNHVGEEIYVHLSENVWEREHSPEEELAPARHCFPFQFTLPKRLPSSWSSGPDERGAEASIRYSVGALIENAGLKSKHQVTQDIAIVSSVDINAPNFSKPSYSTQQANVCCFCCSSGSIAVAVEVPKTGFCVGEPVPFQVTVENGSSRRLSASAAVVEHSEFTARDAQYRSRPITHATVSNDLIGAHSTAVWSSELQPLTVPKKAPVSQRVGIARLYYVLKFIVVVPGAENCVFKLPVTIGNVPSKSEDTASSPV